MHILGRKHSAADLKPIHDKIEQGHRQHQSLIRSMSIRINLILAIVIIIGGLSLWVNLLAKIM